MGIESAPSDHHHRTPGRIQIDCPYCSPNSGSFRLGIKENGRSLACWTCGYLGGGVKAIAKALRQSTGLQSLPIDLYGILRGSVGVNPYLGQNNRFKGHLNAKNRPLVTVPPDRLGELRPVHRAYLRGRGYNPDRLVDEWGIQGIGLHPTLSWRIYIPVIEKGELLNWTSRSTDESCTLRYRNADDEDCKVPIKHLLYGEDKCVTSTIIVQEGPLDVWSIGPGAVCTFGINYDPAQVLKISKYQRRVILFDAEPKAQKQARKLAKELAPFDGETIIGCFETGKDASRAKRKEINQLRKKFRLD